MEIGDAAAAAGMDLVAGSLPANQINEQMNRTRDYIAQFAAGVRAITAGGTGADNVAGVLANLGLAPADVLFTANTLMRRRADGSTDATQVYTNQDPSTGNAMTRRSWVEAVFETQAHAVATYAPGTWVDANFLNKAGGTLTGNLFLATAGVVTSSYVAMYRNGDGRVGISPSARRFKKDIQDRTYTLEDLLRIRVVSYRLRAAVYGTGWEDAPTEVGVIAEDLIDAGLGEFVVFDQDGQPVSVHYERLALVAIGALQDLTQQLDGLTARIDALEAANGNG